MCSWNDITNFPGVYVNQNLKLHGQNIILNDLKDNGKKYEATESVGIWCTAESPTPLINPNLAYTVE